MVFILDEGSKFNAPLSKVWVLAQSETAHKHSSQIEPRRSMEGEHGVLAFGSKMPDGSVARHKMKVHLAPPVGLVIEYVEGQLSGTKLTQYYVPKGNKTGVIIVGDAMSKVIPESQLKGAVLMGLEVAFNEDVENLMRLQ